MNEQEYLELTNQLKEKYESNQLITRRNIRKYNSLYKKVSVCYGLLRTYIDSNFCHAEHDLLLGELRGYLSDILFDHLEDSQSEEEE